MKLLLATNNRHKLQEMKEILASVMKDVEIVSLADVLPEPIEVEETGQTLEENAYIKAKTLHNLTGLPTIADDTGLEIDSLQGQPGVRTARFAGEDATHQDNVVKTLQLMNAVDTEDRSAMFRTVICYCSELRTLFAEGMCKGSIATEQQGKGGFGYDPIFIPEGETRSFAEMESAEKNSISHRGRALQEFANIILHYT